MFKKKNASDYLNEAEVLYKNRNYQNTVKLLDKAINLDSNLTEAYILRANCFIKLLLYEKAINDYSTFLNLIDTTSTNVNNNKQTKLYDNADDKYNNKKAIAYCERGYCKSQLGLSEEAFSDFQESINLNPNDVWTYYRRGRYYNELGLYKEAVIDFNKAMDLKPNFVIAYNDRGIAKANLGFHPVLLMILNYVYP